MEPKRASGHTQGWMNSMMLWLSECCVLWNSWRFDIVTKCEVFERWLLGDIDAFVIFFFFLISEWGNHRGKEEGQVAWQGVKLWIVEMKMLKKMDQVALILGRKMVSQSIESKNLLIEEKSPNSYFQSIFTEGLGGVVSNEREIETKIELSS